MHPILLISLVLIASVSPLLTFTTLWQVKEWRIDRLREHLRAEGAFRQLLGLTRPCIVTLGLIGMYVSPFAIDAALILLAGASVAQILLKKQRFPVKTQKAITLIGSSIAIDIIASYWLLESGKWLLLIPILQSLIVMISWLLFLPLDQILKKRITRRAASLRARFINTTVIGITGSVGKTTTKELIAHILSEKNMLCTPAYVNSEMGVAKWILKELLSRDDQEELILIIEMGAYRAGEIEKLCKITDPSMGIITFIGSQHIALFGSQEKLCDAKGELLECLPEDGHAFLNADNSLCSSMENRCSSPVTTVGTGGHVDLEAFEIEETGSGIRFRVGDITINTRLHGTHNVTNVLLAISVARHLDIPLAKIASRLQSFTPPHQTFSLRSEKGVSILDDTHNASPESFRAAIAWAKAQPAKQKVLLTPGLIELGTDEDRIHRELGAQAKGIFSRVVFTSKHGLNAFTEGYNEPLEQLSSNSKSLEQGDLVLCVGRIGSDTIERLLPHS